MYGTELLEVIGIGDGFFVRGGSSDWRTKKISQEVESELLRLIQKKEAELSGTDNSGADLERSPEKTWLGAGPFSVGAPRRGFFPDSSAPRGAIGPGTSTKFTVPNV
jgi:hypothetical protein